MFLMAAGTGAVVFIAAADLQGTVMLCWNGVNSVVSLLDLSTMTWY